jgi:hypothetical protein
MKLGSLKISDAETKNIISELNSESNKLKNTEELQKLMRSIKGKKHNLLNLSNNNNY